MFGASAGPGITRDTSSPEAGYLTFAFRTDASHLAMTYVDPPAVSICSKKSDILIPISWSHSMAVTANMCDINQVYRHTN